MSPPIDQISLHVVRLNSVEAFHTSYGSAENKTPILIEIKGGGVTGWGECAVPKQPFYNHETPHTALHILKEFALPIFFSANPNTPDECAHALGKIVGNPFARAGLEMAFWDWFAKTQSKPLFELLGGTKRPIDVGVSIGIQKDVSSLLKKAGDFISQGYKRIKIKIGPGHDKEQVKALCAEYRDIPLMVDANSAYTMKDLPLLQDIDNFQLLMIEQPLRAGDIYEHSLVQKELKNPLCLDESISCREDAHAAAALQSCRIINIKPGRVGGLTEARAIHDFCRSRGMPVWCGGMLETGVGRAANICLATLPNFLLPGDISESKRYYLEDIVEPEITLGPGGTLMPLDKPGIGFEVNGSLLKKYTIHTENFSRPI